MVQPIAKPNPETPFYFSAEKVAYWFFRLNGCFSLENFLVHPEIPDDGGTEVDVLGIRFPFRRELSLSQHPIADHPIFTSRDPKIDIVIADATVGKYCKVNSSWMDKTKPNLQRILHVLGVFDMEHEEKVLKNLYKDFVYEDEQYRINIYALGKKKDTGLPSKVMQITWKEILSFVHQRFITYEDYKRQHDQWEDTGKKLFLKATERRDSPENFISYTITHMIN
jgi:hypothetical protein